MDRDGRLPLLNETIFDALWRGWECDSWSRSFFAGFPFASNSFCAIFAHGKRGASAGGSSGFDFLLLPFATRIKKDYTVVGPPRKEPIQI